MVAWIIGAPFIVGGAACADTPAASDILKTTGIQAGVAIHLGATDGAQEIGLTNGGRMLVDGIAFDENSLKHSRQAIQATGLYGVASVEEENGLNPLPYADNLANLVVADLDSLGAKAPPMDEILRVLTPKGIAYLRKNGRWTTTVKPRPAGMDDWTHFDYGADGNGVSHDQLVKPPTFVQWISDDQDIKLGGNPAAYTVFTGIRSANGRVFFEWSAGQQKWSKGPKASYYTGRDGFNGIPLWTLKNATNLQKKEYQFVADGDRVYTFLEKNGPLVALDAATGQVVKTYDQAGKLNEDGDTVIRSSNGVLFETSGDTLYVLDAATGALKWKYTEPNTCLVCPTVAAKENRVFVAVVDQKAKGWGRCPAPISRR